MKRINFALFCVLLFLSSMIWAQDTLPKFSMPNLVGFPDVIEDGETYDLSIKMFNIGLIRFKVGDKLQMHMKIGNYPAEDIGGEITLLEEIVPVGSGVGLLDSFVWELPGYQFPLERFGGGGSNDIIVWPTVMRVGGPDPLVPSPDSAYKSIFYAVGAAFRVNNSYVSGMNGSVQYAGAYLIDVRAENVGITSNTHDVVFYAQLDDDPQLKTEILRISDNVPVGQLVGSTIQTFKPSLLFPNFTLGSGVHYLNIFAVEQGYNNGVQKAVYPIVPGTFPVALKSFTGVPEYNKNIVQLEWVTEHESSNKEFMIQKFNPSSLAFEELEIVQGKGNNTSTAYYAIEDNSPLQGNNHYRLIQKDMDGTTQILETITVVYTLDAMRLISVSPNPAVNEVTIHLFNGLSESIKIELFDSRGILVLSKREDVAKGTIDMSFNVGHLPQGLYFYKIANVSNTYTGTLVKK